MDEQPEPEEPACPACGEPLERAVVDCPACGERLLPEAVTEQLDEQMATAFDSDINTAPRWAVALAALALCIPIAPLVVYSAVIAVGDLPPVALVGLLLAGWLLPAVALSRLPNPSAVLSRGLYLVVVGIGGVLAAVAYDAVTGGASVIGEQAGLVVVLLGVPAVVALLLARRVASRAARQARGEPGPLHKRAGIDPEDDDS